MLAMLISASSASAETFPKIVDGHVYDSVGTPLENAYVTVKILRASDNTTRATLNDWTDEAGFYTVTFDGVYWDVGDTIQVIAEYNSDQRSNSTLADGAPVQTIDVKFPYEIPEFGAYWTTLLGLAGAGAIGAVFLVRKRR
jgi:LPXTG-motif cell wall-anchored protein